MITHGMLELLHARLVANAPRQAGSDEYRMGVDDTIAAVRRLIESATSSGSTAVWRAAEPAGADQTDLAAEYLQLEMTSLLSTIDSLLEQSGPPRPPGNTETTSLLDAKAHLVQARGALRQTHGSVSS